jgi:hypothetical protein
MGKFKDDVGYIHRTGWGERNTLVERNEAPLLPAIPGGWDVI